ncbi:MULTISPECIES: SDR family NAD(P)-dependent oxidoreductase [unclassified Sphingomonas]|uniref:SDR family NAD(P)-dependent oxidoreductase n=1 Tax=unclassified Sphingomonas TaxID=196159 RepID=UPI0021509DC0|nr:MULTISPECIES: SDR family oxidoreductase [unclassified Sphingomonas]MCR5871206.1 SDR family oxidoreductase [Sphingomonas sp. J344]UUY00484.1 SDR family oxidoreductase [Sphingomonas sp. J315]
MNASATAPTGSLPRGLRVAVTGGSAGIGQAICNLLNAQGATVFNLDLKQGSADGAETYIQTDLRSSDSVRQAFETIGQAAAGLDALVNNAGIAFVGGVEDGSDEEWLELLNVNLMGYRRATVCALPLLRTSPSPAIVNISSCSATSGITERAAYSASKGAIHSMTLSIAADLVHEGIRVNGVVPGTVETPFMHALIERASDPAAQRRAYERRQPTAKMVDPVEVAHAVSFLINPACGSVTGSFVVVDGGLASLRTLRS